MARMCVITKTTTVIRKNHAAQGRRRNPDLPFPHTMRTFRTQGHSRAPRRNQREPYQEDDAPRRPAPAKPAKPPKRRKKHRGLKLLLGILLVLLALVVGVYLWIRSSIQMPETTQPIGARKEGAATVLLCGTDQEGTRTDTMMLLYLNAQEQAVTLVSLPRDTLTHTASGNDAKLNSAYGRNNGGEEGMEALLDYVADIIGYRPTAIC